VEHQEPITVPATKTAKPASARPAVDEWGFYDPAQAGLEAVIRRMAAAKNDDQSSGTLLAPRNAGHSLA
jgi:hypothetical protein